MRTINNSTLTAINAAFKTLFLSSYRKVIPIADEIADVQVSNTLEQIFMILGSSPRMRQWIGEREVKNFTANIYRVANLDWESTVEVDRNDIEDDRIGIYRPQIADMGKNAAHLWDDMVITALAAGTTTLCYDGQYFFDTDHPVDIADSSSASQANLFTGRALTAANYAYGRAQMAGFKLGADSRSLRVNPNILLVGPTNEVTAKQITMSSLASDGAGGTFDNVQKGTAKVLVHPDLGTEWYLFDATNTERALIVSKRKEPQFVAKIDATDDAVFWRKKYHYGVDARGVAAYGPWFLAAKFTP